MLDEVGKDNEEALEDSGQKGKPTEYYLYRAQRSMALK